MVRSHPQWLRRAGMVRGGRIGKLDHGLFISATSRESGDVRNSTEFAGGALMDIDCYRFECHDSFWRGASAGFGLHGA